MYKDLGLKDRMKIIRNGIKNGQTPDYSIKQYNINSNGGYNQWKKDIAETTGVDIDNDNNYNYKQFYNDNPTDAWDIVNGKKAFQIPDIYKLVNGQQNLNTYSNLDYDSYTKNINQQFKNQLKEYKKGGKVSQAMKEKYKAYLWNLAKPFNQELLNIGLKPAAIAGILGNIGLESGFNKNATNGTHHGYLQNSTDIRNWIASPKQYGGYDHEQQLQYLIDGLTGNLKGANTQYGRMLNARFKNYLNAVKDVVDPIEAARLWEKYYEISGGQSMAEREEYSKYFYDQMMGNDINQLNTIDKQTEIQNIKPKPINQPLIDNNIFNLPPNIEYQRDNIQPSRVDDNFNAFYLFHNRNKERENLINQMLLPVNYTDDYINNKQ